MVESSENMSNVKSVQVNAAVCGFHYHRSSWAPEPELLLNFLHEVGNTFDVFVIKVCGRENKKIMDHLPMEISRVTKFLLDRRANVTAKLTSTNYSRFGARWSRDLLYHNVFDGCHRCYSLSGRKVRRTCQNLVYWDQRRENFGFISAYLGYFWGEFWSYSTKKEEKEHSK